MHIKSAPGITGVLVTDKSSTITVGGTSQTGIAANADRVGWLIQNNNASGNLYVTKAGHAASTSDGKSFLLPPYSFIGEADGTICEGVIKITGDSSAMTYFAEEYT